MSIQVDKLLTNLLHEFGAALKSEQFIVEGVAASHNFNIVDVVAVDCRQAHATVVHLTGENFISKEPVSEYATIRIWAVQTFLSCHIWKISQQSLHTIVLFGHAVNVLGMFVYLVAAENPLQQQEWIEVFMLPAWSIIEHTYWWIYHLIISDKQQAWIKNGFLKSLDWLWTLSL